MKAMLAGFGISLCLGGGIWALGRFLPGFLTGKVHGFFVWAKAAPWFRDLSKPWRLRWLLATAELLEQEIPDPGQGKALYTALGAQIAGSTAILAGTGGKWASALEKVGDALDTELDGEVLELAKVLNVPPPAAPAS